MVGSPSSSYSVQVRRCHSQGNHWACSHALCSGLPSTPVYASGCVCTVWPGGRNVRDKTLLSVRLLLQAPAAGPDCSPPPCLCPSLPSTQVGDNTTRLLSLIQVTAVLFLGSFYPQGSLNRLWRWPFPHLPHNPITLYRNLFLPVHPRVASQILNHLRLMLCSRHHPLLPPLSAWFSLLLITPCLAGSTPAALPVGSLCWAPGSRIPPSCTGLATCAGVCCGSTRLLLPVRPFLSYLVRTKKDTKGRV